MSVKISPRTVRNIASEITGMKIKGTVEMRCNDKGEMYIIHSRESKWLCLKQSTGWLITQIGKDDMIKVIWSTTPTEKTEIGAKVIDLLLQTFGPSVHPKFQKERCEIKGEIERKTYITDIGPIILHSRRHLKGTEGVMEFVNDGVFLRYIWERKTSSIDMNNMRKLTNLPF